MTRKHARCVEHAGQMFVSINDLRELLRDDDIMLQSAAVMKFAHEVKHDTALECVRRAIAAFILVTTGVDKKDN